MQVGTIANNNNISAINIPSQRVADFFVSLAAAKCCSNCWQRREKHVSRGECANKQTAKQLWHNKQKQLETKVVQQQQK